MTKTRLGLPPRIRACLFDLDGVLTETSALHATSWCRMFNGFLAERARRSGQPYVPFDTVKDYEVYVDGKPRDEGTKAFLASRGIQLPEGLADDPATAETVHGLGVRKNELFRELLRDQGVEPFPGSLRYVRAVALAGLGMAVVSSSRNCHEVLVAAGLAQLFKTQIDGVVAAREHLAGKPAPDTYLAGARAVGVRAGEAAVFEDALAGVEAGKAGRFGFVVGVDRLGQADALRTHGATVVVTDLAELLEPM